MKYQKYTFTKDNRPGYGWVLSEQRLGKDKHGNDKIHSDDTYHSNLRQVLDAIIDREGGRCSEIENLSTAIIDAKELFLETYEAEITRLTEEYTRLKSELLKLEVESD